MDWIATIKYGLLLIMGLCSWLFVRWINNKAYKKGYAFGKRETEEKYHALASDIHKRLADVTDTGYKLRNETPTTFRLP